MKNLKKAVFYLRLRSVGMNHKDAMFVISNVILPYFWTQRGHK